MAPKEHQWRERPVKLNTTDEAVIEAWIASPLNQTLEEYCAFVPAPKRAPAKKRAAK